MYVLLPLVLKEVNFLSMVLTETLIYLLQMSEELCSVFQEGNDTLFEILHHNVMVRKAGTEGPLPEFKFWFWYLQAL